MSPAVVDLDAATQYCVITSWASEVWRLHSPRYAADSVDGALAFTGRFHRGADRYPVEETWPALYTSLDKAIPLAEKLRHTDETNLSKLRKIRLTKLWVVLSRVMILCHPEEYLEMNIEGLTRESMCAGDEFCHQLALHARTQAKAMLVPSCSGIPGGNLIIFSDLQPRTSLVQIRDYYDLDLG